VPKLARAFFFADKHAHQFAGASAHEATPLETVSQSAADRSPPHPRVAAHSGHRL